MRFSTLARPSISPDEAEHAEVAICRVHDGMIKTQPTPQDTDGRVYYCPIGDCAWRYTQRLDDVNQLPQLQYGWTP